MSRLKDILTSTIAGPALTTFIIKVLGAGFAFLSQVLLARWLGSDDYGYYVYLVAWALLLAIPFGMGFPQATIRFVANYVQTHSWAELKGLTRWLSGQMAMAIGVLVAIVFIGITMFKPADSVLIVLAAILIPLSAVLTIQAGISRGLKRMILAYSPEFLLRPALIVGLVFLGHIVLGYDINVQLGLLATVGAYLIAAVSQLGGLLWQLPQEIRHVSPVFRKGEWRRVAFPLLIIAGFMIVLNRTDVLMLGLLSTKASVGHYDAAYRTAALASFVLLSVNSIAAPSIAAAHAAGDTKEMQRIATHSARLSFWPSLGLSIVLAFLAEFILGMFGPEFISARYALYILLIGQLINASVGSVGNLMTMTGHERESAKIFGVSALVNLVLNALVIPRYGAVGAGAVTAFTMALWNVWMYVFVARKMNIRSSVFNF